MSYKNDGVNRPTKKDDRDLAPICFEGGETEKGMVQSPRTVRAARQRRDRSH